MQDNNKLIRNDSISRRSPPRRIETEILTHNTQNLVETSNLAQIGVPCGVAKMTMEAEISEYTFPQTPESLLDQYRQGSEATIFKKTIPNNSAATAKVEVKQTYSRTSEFSWGLEENLKIFSTLKVSVGVPLIAEGELETGIEANVGSNQQWTESNSKTYEITESVEVPPYTTVQMTAYTQAIKDLPLPFTAEMKVILKSGIPMSDEFHNRCAMLQLAFRGYENIERLDGNEERGVRIRVRGNFKGTFGFIGFLDIKDVTKKSSRFNRYDQKRSKKAMCNRIR